MSQVDPTAKPVIPAQPPVAAGPAVPNSPDADKLAPPVLTLENRVPFTGFTKKLDIVSHIDGYVLYWINDEPGRIPTLVRHGYEFVAPEEIPDDMPQLDGLSQNRDIGGKVSRPTKTMLPNGQPMRMYLMKLRREFFEQDEAAKAERQAAIDRAIAGGGIDINPEQAYRPDVAGPRLAEGTVGGNVNKKFPSGMESGATNTREKTMTGLGARRR